MIKQKKQVYYGIEIMTRCGIGPGFSIVTVVFGALTGLLTYLFPNQYIMTFIPYWILIIFGIGLSAVGIIIYIYSLRIFNCGYRKDQLVVDGPYSVVRHPIYAAWILMICPGFVLFFQSWLMLFVPLVAYVSFKAYIYKEDNYLKDKFGQVYLDYRITTNELFPSWGFWRNNCKEIKKSCRV